MKTANHSDLGITLQSHPFLDRRLAKSSSSNFFSECGLIRRLKVCEDSQDVLFCENSILPQSQMHLLSYATSSGQLGFVDLRAKTAIALDRNVCGFERGIPTAFSQGEDPYSLYIGTLGGYVMVYDIRFNATAQIFKNLAKYPITSISSF